MSYRAYREDDSIHTISSTFYIFPTAIIIFMGVGSGSLAGQHAPALASAAVGGAVFLTGTLA